MQRRHLLLGTLAAFAAGPAWAQASLAYTDAQAAALYTRERRYLPLPQGRIAYIDRGQGETMLFLHGFPLSGFQWRGAIDRLSPRFRCLAPDFLGLGLSEVASGQGVAPMDQVAMLIAFLDQLGVARVHLVANDSGGAVAQLMMAHHPARVRSVLLTNCDTEIDSPPPALEPVIALARQGTYPDQWLVPWVRDKALARSKDGLGGMCFSNPDHPTDAAIDQYLAPLVATAERKQLTNLYTLGLTPNPLAGISKALNASTIPVAVVWGTADTIFSQDGPDYLSGVLPKLCRVRLVPGAKLFFPEEYPDIIAEEALRLAQQA